MAAAFLAAAAAQAVLYILDVIGQELDAAAAAAAIESGLKCAGL